MASNHSFPVTTRQASKVIAGFPTEIMLQFFQDRTLVFVNQGKIGRMVQISPPTSNRRRTGQRRDPFNEDDEEQQDAAQQGDANGHNALDDTVLPPPDASSATTNLFGTSRDEEVRQLEQLYASQIAAIIFAKSKGQSEDEDIEGTPNVLRDAKPVVVALGFKPAFLQSKGGDDNMQERRTRFKEVMQLINSIV